MVFTLLLSFCGFIAGVFSQTSTQDGLTVRTTEGLVVGTKAMDGNYIAFYGIPYAGSVSGEYRFKEAPEPDKRNVEFKANNDKILCAQPGPHGLVGQEDCLTLNIFTKNFTTPKPVIVWLDGEEYSNTNDTPRFSFRSLVQADIVFISLNYRLSIFGFLCLRVEDAPGNAGLKDVVKGLNWIKRNVASFGGDPNNVMILGHGSGAAMVDLLTMSPLTNGSISKAVALSGSALSPWAVAYDPVGYAKALGAKLQYTGQTNAELAKHLNSTNVDVLINEINQFTFTNNSVLFAPCVENTKLKKRSFLEDDPLKLLRSGNYEKIPFIASYVNQEGTIRVEEAVHGNWLEMMQKDFQAFLPANLAFKNETVRKNLSQEVRLTYFGDSRDISTGQIDAYFTYQGESLIIIPILRDVKERAVSGWKDLWLLEFSFIDDSNDWPYPDIRLDGVKHGEILNYIFDLDTRPVNELLKKSLIRRFAYFAKTGEPNGRTGIVWSPYTVEKSNYLSIKNGNDVVVEDVNENPRDQSLKFWKNTLSEYYATAQQVSSAGMLLASGFLLILSLLALQIM